MNNIIFNHLFSLIYYKLQTM